MLTIEHFCENITWVQSQSTPQGGQSSSYKVRNKELTPDETDQTMKT